MINKLKGGKTMKHTKGTWYTSGSVNIHEQRIIADEETGQTIAVCYGRGEHDNRKSETEANAHLIAAAPELLEACEMLLDRLNYHGNIDILREEGPIEDLRNAITKAQGN